MSNYEERGQRYKSRSCNQFPAQLAVGKALAQVLCSCQPGIFPEQPKNSMIRDQTCSHTLNNNIHKFKKIG